MFLRLNTILLATALTLGISSVSIAKNISSQEIESLISEATKGNAKAQNTLGSLYEKGLGVPQDYALAFNWYEKAAKQDHPYAQNNLSFLYGNGLGVTQDYVKSREWNEKASAQGNGHAQNNVGILYERGIGVAENMDIARHWYKQSCGKNLQRGCDNYLRVSRL